MRGVSPCKCVIMHIDMDIGLPTEFFKFLIFVACGLYYRLQCHERAYRAAYYGGSISPWYNNYMYKAIKFLSLIKKPILIPKYTCLHMHFVAVSILLYPPPQYIILYI